MTPMKSAVAAAFMWSACASSGFAQGTLPQQSLTWEIVNFNRTGVVAVAQTEPRGANPAILLVTRFRTPIAFERTSEASGMLEHIELNCAQANYRTVKTDVFNPDNAVLLSNDMPSQWQPYAEAGPRLVPYLTGVCENGTLPKAERSYTENADALLNRLKTAQAKIE